MGINKDDVKPINLKSEKEITAEFQKIQAVLENQNADWNKRMEALKTLQGMVVGNTWTHELFLPNLLKLYTFINYQLKDLRSAVQKEACKLLALSAEKMQKSFEQAAIKYISKDSLLTIVNSGNKILCENAHSCIQSIIEYCPSVNFMPQLLEESQSKSQQVRSKVSQYLVQILPELNQSQLDRYLPQLDSTISKNVSDANPEVRQNFRQKAERILGNADTSIKKLLQEEIINGQDSQNNNNQNNTLYSSSNRLLQHKSLDTNIGSNLVSTSTNNSQNPQKLQASVSLPNEDNHFNFASSQTNALNSQTPPPRQVFNKASNNSQLKVNNFLPNGQANLNTQTPTMNNNNNNPLNKSRNGSGHFSQDRNTLNNFKQGQDQMTIFQSGKETQQKGGSRNEAISPLKNHPMSQSRQNVGTISQTASTSQTSQSTKNISQATSYASANFSTPTINEQGNNDQLKHKKSQASASNLPIPSQNNQNTSANQRYNNHQAMNESKTSATSSSNVSSQIQQNDNGDRYENLQNNQKKVNAYRSQDPKKSSNNDNYSLQTQQLMSGSRVNSSLTRPPTTAISQAAYKKPNYQKRNSLTEENQNSQDSSGQEQDDKIKKIQPNNMNNNKFQQNTSQLVSSTKAQQQNKGMIGNAKQNQLNGDKNNQKKQNTKQYRVQDDNYNGDRELEDEDYEQYDRRSNDQEDEYEEEEENDYDQNENNDQGRGFEKHKNNQYGGKIYQDDHQDNYDQYSNPDDNSDSQDYQTQQKNNYYKSQNNAQKEKNNTLSKPKNSNYVNNNNQNKINNNQQNLNRNDNQNIYDDEDNFQNKQRINYRNSEDIVQQLGPRTQDYSIPQQQQTQNQKNGDGNKRIVKSAMNSLKNSDSKNGANRSQIQQNLISQSKSSAVSPVGQQLLNGGNISTKNKNFMTATNDVEDGYLRLNLSPPIDEQQQNKYTNNFKNKQQLQMTKSSNTLPKGKIATASSVGLKNEQQMNQAQFQQQQYNWRDEDLELLLDKINSNATWSTRVSAFESLKEVIGELNIQNNQSKQNDIERINPALMKRIVSAHIEHLSDSHFKVVSVCLDSLISLVSYDSSFILPKLDSLIFKVLNNLIDTKDVVSSKANFLVNILSKVYTGDKLIEPIQKVLEQTNKNLLKICSLEVLMVTVKNADEYYQVLSNVRHTVQLMCMIIQENQSQKQMALPCLGIILALRDHNQQGTLHSILSLTNQNQITSLRNLSYEYAQDLEEDLRRYVQKENIKPSDKIAKQNMKQFQIDQINPSQSTIISNSNNNGQNLQQSQLVSTSSTSISQGKPLPQTNQSNQNIQYNQNSYNNQPNNNGRAMSNIIQKSQGPGFTQQNQGMVSKTNRNMPNQDKTSSSSPEKHQAPQQYFDINRIEEIYSCVSDFESNEQFIIQQINEILLNTIEFFKQQSRKIKEQSLKILQILFIRNYFFLTIQPHTVIECLSIYPHIPKDMDFYQVDEVIDEMIDCVPHLIFMKALVEKLNTEKPPQLQIMIKKISSILRKARKEEIRPFLDHIIDSFKITINDASPDVRKSVVFCLVDLKFLMQEEVEPYLHQFTGNQQKLVDIYIKKRISNTDGNTLQD